MGGTLPAFFVFLLFHYSPLTYLMATFGKRRQAYFTLYLLDFSLPLIQSQKRCNPVRDMHIEPVTLVGKACSCSVVPVIER